MDEELDQYNGDSLHDMWVDYDYNENTGELPYIDDETDLETIFEDQEEIE